MTTNQGPDGQKIKGIDYADTNNFVRTIFLPRIFFCPDNFLVSTTFCRTTFLSWQFFCPDNFFVRTTFFVRTKGHLPPSRILPFCLCPVLSCQTLTYLQSACNYQTSPTPLRNRGWVWRQWSAWTVPTLLLAQISLSFETRWMYPLDYWGF